MTEPAIDKPNVIRDPLTLTQADYARRVGLPRQRIHTLAREGRLALDGAGRVLVQRSDTMLAAMTQTDLGSGGNADVIDEIAAARLRVELAKANKLELEVAEKSGQVVSKAAVDRAAREAATVVRQRLEQLPERLAGELVGADAGAIRSKLAAAVHHALVELTGGEAEAAE